MFRSLCRDKAASTNITIAELDNQLDIPGDIDFYAAHQKLCLFSVFARESGYNCLVDSDVIANYEALQLANIIDEVIGVDGWVYDISDQTFPAYGTKRVQDDLQMLGVVNPFPRWYGGEFLLGNSDFYSYLDGKCSQRMPLYLKVWKGLHHVGDETLISAVLNDSDNEIKIADAGASGLIVRHWSGKTRHIQKGHRALLKSLLWHLPDSKEILERFYQHGDIRTLYMHIRVLEMIKKIAKTLRNVVL